MVTKELEKLDEALKSPPVKNSNPLSIPVIAHLLSKGYSQAKIGRLFNVSTQAVNQYIKAHKQELQELKDFDDLMSTTLKYKTFEIINSIDERDIKKASLQQKMTSGAIGIEKIKLLSEKSNNNPHTLLVELACKIQIKPTISSDKDSNSPVIIDVSNSSD